MRRLHFLFGKNFERATRIVDQGGVKTIRGQRSGRSIFQVLVYSYLHPIQSLIVQFYWRVGFRFSNCVSFENLGWYTLENKANWMECSFWCALYVHSFFSLLICPLTPPPFCVCLGSGGFWCVLLSKFWHSTQIFLRKWLNSWIKK